MDPPLQIAENRSVLYLGCVMGVKMCLRHVKILIRAFVLMQHTLVICGRLWLGYQLGIPLCCYHSLSTRASEMQ